MLRNSMQLSFDAISQNESFARTVAAAFLAQLNPTIEEMTDVRTAVSEAVTNAIIHGYEGHGGTVYMDCTVEDYDFSVIIRDTGKGIEDVPLAMQPFFTSLPSMERSGMGFSVMEAFMDSVVVNSKPGGGTEVIMKKRIAEHE